MENGPGLKMYIGSYNSIFFEFLQGPPCPNEFWAMGVFNDLGVKKES